MVLCSRVVVLRVRIVLAETMMKTPCQPCFRQALYSRVPSYATSLSLTHTHTHSCDEDSGFTHTRLWYTSWQASAIRVVSTTLAMLPVDIFVNVNRIGTFLDSCSHASAAA
jgi:hypothetical protein